jgi:Tfp pilus assembly major pilin PilA
MADTAKRFSGREIAGLKKSGVLDFLAKVTGVKAPEEVKWIRSKDGTRRLHATYTIEGRNTIKAAIRGLSTKDYSAAVEAGFIDVLALAMGFHDKDGKPSHKVFERVRGIESNNGNGTKTEASTTQTKSNGS